MLIESILTKSRTKAKLTCGSKKRVLESLANLFSEESGDINARELFQSLINRERLGSTGIGQGIAIPHCRFDTGGETFGACLTLEEPIDFDAVDNEPVDLIFAILVPQEAHKNHLEALASIAEMLQKPGFVAKMRATDNHDKLFQIALDAT